jgi:hypothetical protein
LSFHQVPPVPEKYRKKPAVFTTGVSPDTLFWVQKCFPRSITLTAVKYKKPAEKVVIILLIDVFRPKAGIQTAYRYDIQVTATFRERTVGPPTLCQLIGLTRYSTFRSNTA